MRRYAVIVAGGSGSRYGGPVPKQFLELGGIPVLMRSVSVFSQVGAQVIVVLPAGEGDHWRELCCKHGFLVEHSVVTGGASRTESVANALSVIEANPGDVVAVHDAVRPLVPVEVVEQAYSVAAESGSAVPVVPVTDSLRHIDKGGASCAVNRSEFVAVQTPQAFLATELKEAYSRGLTTAMTDDASVYEAAGYEVTLISGSAVNIKITNPSDIAVAKALLSR